MNCLCPRNVMILTLLPLLALTGVLSEPPVTARCGRPLLPPYATKWLITPERSRFDNKEKVIIICKKDEFIHHRQEVECKKGRWVGKEPRCGQQIEANVNHLNVYECDSSAKRQLLSQQLNQTPEAPQEFGPLPANSFHALRVPLDQNITAKGHNCYTFEARFDKRVQISFLTIDVWHKNTKQRDRKVLEANAIVSKHRNCSLQHTNVHDMGNDTIVGYYFFCDVTNGFDGLKKEDSEPMNTLSLNIRTNFTEDVGLESVIIGSVFKNKYGKPECGNIESKNIGFDIQIESYSSIMFISCNDSFIDMTDQNSTTRAPNGNPKHKFICNANGLWEGQWPVCVPIKTCAKEEVSKSMDSSVTVEEVGNVYFLNQSKWYAINESYIRYTCVHENDIMVGKNIRSCMKSGKWNNKAPYCTRTGLSGLTIAGILFAVLLVFVGIVLYVFRMHSKRVKRELRETRNEIQETTRRQISEEFYADVKDDDYYDNTELNRKNSCAYETVDYEMIADPPRYEAGPQSVKRKLPEYVDMLQVK